ncbi:type II toxin-antitoxin system RelE/ParE family toxin [bacterium]|nr:type II toxin-antitoxin system RelE/ParE family toxin [bacterium]
MIKSFSDQLTEKLFLGETLTKKERKTIGSLNQEKAFERLALIDIADEKQLLLAPAVHYHALRGTKRFSIDADSRNSKWRFTFTWENDEKSDVQLVKLEDTH